MCGNLYGTGNPRLWFSPGSQVPWENQSPLWPQASQLTNLVGPFSIQNQEGLGVHLPGVLAMTVVKMPTRSGADRDIVPFYCPSLPLRSLVYSLLIKLKPHSLSTAQNSTLSSLGASQKYRLSAPQTLQPGLIHRVKTHTPRHVGSAPAWDPACP